MSETAETVDIARRFAVALDARDFAAAAAFLAANCQYDSPRATCVGPTAIVQSYRESDTRARQTFDRVEYRNEAVAAGPNRVRLTYYDEIHYGSAQHTYSCAQILRFNRGNKIVLIEHVDLPGERDRLKEFCESHGVAWD